MGMSRVIEIGGVKVEPASKKAWFLNVDLIYKGRHWFTLDLPVTVINGRNSGSTLCLTAGIHGTEYPGMEAATRLSREIEPQKLSGTLIVVPIVNMSGFQARTYVCPLDGKNIQGLFPGDPEGSASQKIAYTLFNEIISKANYYVDMHGGDIHESPVPCTMFYKTGNKDLDSDSEFLAESFRTKYILSPKRPGWVPSRLTWTEAPKKGIPAAVAEIGEGDRLREEDTSIHLNGVLNIMKSLGMIEGETSEPVKHEVSHRMELIFARHEGMFHPKVKPGSTVSEGDLLGEIRGIWGETVETLVSPINGFIMWIIHNPATTYGETLATIGEL